VRGYAREWGGSALPSALGDAAADVGRLVPELREQLPELSHVDPISIGGRQFHLMDGLARLLAELAKDRPVLWVVDDLQWADAASLRALAFAGHAIRDERVLVLGASRTEEVRLDPSLAEALAELVHASRGERIELEGLSLDEVAELVACTDAALPVREIWERTHGNPFFVRETLEQLRDRRPEELGAWLSEVPPAVELMIARRVRGLSESAREVVSIASLVGRRFEARVVTGAGGFAREQGLEALDEARRGALLRHCEDEPGSFEFAHDLTREALRAQLGAPERAELHARIADALERCHPGRPESLAQAAWHSLAVARAGGDAKPAIERAQRAADAARAQLAWEEEARQLQNALAALDLGGNANDGERCALLQRLAEAQLLAGSTDGARNAALRAAELARRLGDAEALARAADAFVADPVEGTRDAASIELLEEALEGIHGGDSPHRLRLLARLAWHLHAAGEPAERPRSLLVEVRALAKRLGDASARALVERALRRDDWGALRELPEVRRAISSERIDAAKSLRAGPSATRRRLKIAGTLSGAALMLFAAAIWLSWPAPLGLALDLAGLSGPPVNPPLPDKPSVAVLPFTNLSDDPEQEYFSDGITEDLTTDLSRNPTLFVIARNSAFTYKGAAVDVRQVGRELGVRYVLEGSVRRDADRVRITAQLIDATTGVHLWSERYDRELGDIFALQSEISEQLQMALRAEIQAEELGENIRRGTENLAAYDAAMQALAHLFGQRHSGVVVDARRLAARAIELDPGYARAYAILGQTYWMEYGMAWSNDPTLLDTAEAWALRAQEVDPESAAGEAVLATVAISRGQFDEALVAADRLVAANPNLATGHGTRAWALTGVGRPLAAARATQTMLRLNPRGLGGSSYAIIYARMNIAVGRNEKGAEFFEQARRANPDIIIPRVNLAAYHESGGRHQEASALVAEILSVVPEFTAEWGGRYVHPAFCAEGREMLRRAGLPDVAPPSAEQTPLGR